MNIIFNYDKENYKASCIIEDKNIIGVGNATCHPDDVKYVSENIGCHIAEQRAKIHFLQNRRECSFKPALEALNHLYSTMIQSRNFNQHSYEAKRIRKEIKNLKNEIQKTNNLIINIQTHLKDYIDYKDKFNQLYNTKNRIKNKEITENEI